ncbi:MAG: SOS response-associated peptidase [Pseudomonadota bacterium]
MCGRYALHAHPDVVTLEFALRSVPLFAPRYNIAPGAEVLIVRQDGAALARWGLVPGWAKDAAVGARLINARAETLAQKPSFRDAYRRRRCLIPASGFYEWRGEAGRKQPFYVHPSQGQLFAFAGLWERWRDLETCTVITTDANAAMRAIHDRMPVIVPRADYAGWLGGGEGLLKPCPDDIIGIRRVGRAVNDARNDSPALLEASDG